MAEEFLELKDNPHHRRASLVVMTTIGEQAYEKALKLQMPWVNRLGEGISQKRITAAAELLEELKNKLEKMESNSK